MWRLWFKRFGCRVVMLLLGDGTACIRFATFSVEEYGICVGIMDKVLLYPNKTTSVSHISKWVEL